MRHSIPVGILCNSVITLMGIGCASPTVNIPASTQRPAGFEGHDEESRKIAADPVAFLEQSLEETRKIKAFTAMFQRQERLGLLRELKPQENIVAEFRNRPFSVRFTWLNDDSEFKQCVYVRGRNDNKVMLMPRKGLAGQPAQIQSYPTMFAVLFAKARNPITDFGPRRMMERTMSRIENATKVGDVIIKLCDPAEIGPEKEACFHLELRYPSGDEFACKLQDIYISARTRLPVATYLWLPGPTPRCRDTLDAMYAYCGLRPMDHLSDDHFQIDSDRSAAVAGVDDESSSNKYEPSSSTESAPPGESSRE